MEPKKIGDKLLIQGMPATVVEVITVGDEVSYRVDLTQTQTRYVTQAQLEQMAAAEAAQRQAARPPMR